MKIIIDNTKTLFLKCIELLESYVGVLFLSLFIGIVFANDISFLASYSTLFLGIIFFLSALKVDLKEIYHHSKDIKTLILFTILMLFILPWIVYTITFQWDPNLAIALMILAAMPAGMTTPLLSEICKGKQSLALILTISSSLLAPITIPFMIKILAGSQVQVSFYEMFISLSIVIFVPFILANIVKKFFHLHLKATFFTFKPLSILLLGLLIMGIVANQADHIIQGFRGETLHSLISLCLFFIMMHLIAYSIFFFKKPKERVTFTVCFTYMNFTLAIYLTGQFFPQPEILIPVILSVLPWSLFIIPFKYITHR